MDMDTITTYMTTFSEHDTPLIAIELQAQPMLSDPIVTIDGGLGWKAWLTADGRVYQKRGDRVRRVRFGALKGLMELVRDQSTAAYAAMQARAEEAH